MSGVQWRPRREASAGVPSQPRKRSDTPASPSGSGPPNAGGPERWVDRRGVTRRGSPVPQVWMHWLAFPHRLALRLRGDVEPRSQLPHTTQTIAGRVVQAAWRQRGTARGPVWCPETHHWQRALRGQAMKWWRRRAVHEAARAPQCCGLHIESNAGRVRGRWRGQ